MYIADFVSAPNWFPIVVTSFEVLLRIGSKSTIGDIQTASTKYIIEEFAHNTTLHYTAHHYTALHYTWHTLD